MRIAKKDLQYDLSPYQCGQQAYQDGLRLDAALDRFGITDKMRDQQRAFSNGYRQERVDDIEARLGREIDEDADDTLQL